MSKKLVIQVVAFLFIIVAIVISTIKIYEYINRPRINVGEIYYYSLLDENIDLVLVGESKISDKFIIYTYVDRNTKYTYLCYYYYSDEETVSLVLLKDAEGNPSIYKNSLN